MKTNFLQSRRARGPGLDPSNSPIEKSALRGSNSRVHIFEGVVFISTESSPIATLEIRWLIPMKDLETRKGKQPDTYRWVARIFPGITMVTPSITQASQRYLEKAAAGDLGKYEKSKEKRHCFQVFLLLTKWQALLSTPKSTILVRSTNEVIFFLCALVRMALTRWFFLPAH